VVFRVASSYIELPKSYGATSHKSSYIELNKSSIELQFGLGTTALLLLTTWENLNYWHLIKNTVFVWPSLRARVKPVREETESVPDPFHRA
jgi:hypothetical protein